MLKHIKKNPRKTAAIWIICGEKKKKPTQNTPRTTLSFSILNISMCYINNIHEEELFDLILLFPITPIYNWNSNTSLKV